MLTLAYHRGVPMKMLPINIDIRGTRVRGGARERIARTKWHLRPSSSKTATARSILRDRTGSSSRDTGWVQNEDRVTDVTDVTDGENLS